MPVQYALFLQLRLLGVLALLLTVLGAGLLLRLNAPAPHAQQLIVLPLLFALLGVPFLLLTVLGAGLLLRLNAPAPHVRAANRSSSALCASWRACSASNCA
ncbi:hypothetical protein A0O00_04665 [Proteus mirabilis]|nr:hypothetical protein A0O00_04665 [Proteus mirabilis]